MSRQQAGVGANVVIEKHQQIVACFGDGAVARHREPGRGLDDAAQRDREARDARRAKNKNASLFDWISTHRGGDIETCHAGAIRDEISRLLQMGDTGNLEETEAGLRKIFNQWIEEVFCREIKNYWIFMKR